MMPHLSNCSRIGLLLLSGVTTLLVWTSSVLAEATLSLEEFLGMRSKWAALDGTTYQIEGRYSFFSNTQLRMENCDLEFILTRIFSKPGNSTTILIAGRLEKREQNNRTQKIVFVVTDLQPQPSDIDRYKNMRGGLSSAKAEEWYKLADWGAARAKFYHDDELKKESALVFRNGVQAELRAEKMVTSTLLRTLAQKLASRESEPELQAQYLHEALWLDFNASRKDKSRGGEGEILTLMAKQLPGTNTPLTDADTNLKERYLANPVAVFSEADVDTRKKCARAFYVTVMRSRILRDAAENGMNGYAIATRIETELPEYASEASQYRQKEREYHLGRVGTMTRKELNEVIKRFENLDVPEFLLELKKNWLASREKQADPKNVSELIELSDNYAQLVDDKEAAVRVLKKAYESSPGTQLISDLLADYGLALHKGVWMPKQDVPAPPADPLGTAIRDGEVKVGMNVDQVRSALGIEPTRKTRVVTSSNLQEWWLYEDHGLSIQFTRRRRTEPAVVSKVTTLRAAAPAAVPQKKPVGRGL